MPIDYTTMKYRPTANTYTIHHFASSWQNKNERLAAKLLRGLYYVLGKRFFGFLTRVYTKKIMKRLRKIDKKLKFTLYQNFDYDYLFE